MNPLSQSLNFIKTYISWYNTGQEQQTGLSITPFLDLYTGSTSILNQLSMINHTINAFHNSWENFVQNPLLNMASLFELYLTKLQQEVNDLISSASVVKSNAENLSSTVSTQINNLNTQIQTYTYQYQMAQNEYNNAINQYNDAESQLSGSKGFLTGFLTGISFGIYNKVKIEMNAANDAKNNAQASMNASQQAMSNLNNSRNALNSCIASLSELDTLMTGLTDLQNATNASTAACKQGAIDEHNAANAFDSEVNKIFVKLANPPIQSLFALGNEISNSI